MGKRTKEVIKKIAYVYIFVVICLFVLAIVGLFFTITFVKMGLAGLFVVIGIILFIVSLIIINEE